MLLQLQLQNEKRSVEQLKSDLQNERSKSQDESQRLHQDIVLLKEEVDLTKRELQEVQQINLQFKSEIELASEELDRARHVHEDQTSEVCLFTVWTETNSYCNNFLDDNLNTLSSVVKRLFHFRLIDRGTKYKT